MMPYLYWGFEQLRDEEVERLLQKTKAVLFLSDFVPLTRGINRKAEKAVASFVRGWFSSARDEQLHQVLLLFFEWTCQMSGQQCRHDSNRCSRDPKC